MSIWDLKLQDPTTDTLTKARLKVVLYLSESLLQQRAVLLPTVCQVFLETYGGSHSGSIVSVELNLEVGDSRFSSRWLLHQLITYIPTWSTSVSTGNMAPCYFEEVVTC